MTELRWDARDLLSKMPDDPILQRRAHLVAMFTGPQVCVAQSDKMRPLGIMGDLRTVIWESGGDQTASAP